MLRRYGIHGIAGVGGVAPVFGVSASMDNSASCTFELLARFNVANQGYANGQVLGVAEGVDVGQLTVTELAGSAAVFNNQGRMSSKPANGWAQLGWVSQGISRAFGKAAFTSFTVDAIQLQSFGWNDAAAVDNPSGWDYGIALLFTGNIYSYSRNVSRAVATGVANTSYELCILLGGYDVNGIPWDDTEALANFTYGCSCFIKGGAFTDWTLLWRSPEETTATLYVVCEAFGTGTYDYDNLRVPEYDYSSVVQPMIKDTMTDVGLTSLDAHSPNVNSVGNPWVENSGNWRINAGGTAAQLVATLALSSATIETGLSDVWLEAWATTTLNFWSFSQNSGLILRLSDANNNWRIVFTRTNFSIVEVNGGVPTPRTNFALALASGVFYRVVASSDGQEIRGFIPTQNATGNFSSAFNQNATKHGITVYTNTEEADNFSVLPRASSDYDGLDNCP